MKRCNFTTLKACSWAFIIFWLNSRKHEVFFYDSFLQLKRGKFAMKRERRFGYLSAAALFAFCLSACTTNPDGSVSNRTVAACSKQPSIESQTLCENRAKPGLVQQTLVGAAAGAIGGAIVGVAVGKLADEDPKDAAGMGAATGALAGSAAGAGHAMLDRKIGNSMVSLARKVDTSLGSVRASILALERDIDENEELIGDNNRRIRQLKSRRQLSEHEIDSLKQLSTDTNNRFASTSQSIRQISGQIDQINSARLRPSSNNQDEKIVLESQRSQLEKQKTQLANQKRVINALLGTIKNKTIC